MSISVFLKKFCGALACERVKVMGMHDDSCERWVKAGTAPVTGRVTGM
jgi:hypothetical protein